MNNKKNYDTIKTNKIPYIFIQVNGLFENGSYQKSLSKYLVYLDLIKKVDEQWNKGDYKEAMVYLDKCLELDLDNTEVWIKKGIAFSIFANVDAALDCFNKVLEMNPQDEAALFNKGKILDIKGKNKEALDYFEHVIKLNPKNADAWYFHGNNLYKLGHIEEAIVSYDKATTVNWLYEMAWHNKWVALKKLGRFEEAGECLPKTNLLTKPAEYIDIMIGEAFEDIAHFEEAIEWYNKALDWKPEFEDAWIKKGFALFRYGRYIDALACYDRILQINPANYQALQHKNHVLEMLGNR